MVKWREKELKPGLMGIHSKDNSKIIFNMGLASSFVQRIIRRHQKNGEMAKDGLGIRMEPNQI